VSSLPLYAHGISEADKQSMIAGNYMKYIELGASHMLTGYDHLLFLFGVIFFLTKFKDIVKFITAFTLGHSITLIFATFMAITANYYLGDAIIAITVIYKGFDNLDGFKKYLNMKSPNLLMLVFIFGLIHGFGLSTRLQQLPLGTDGLLFKIISFNVGVEVGQVLALTIMLVILNVWRKSASFEKFSTVSNFSLIVLGVLLFLMQMHGYSHQIQANELAFSKLQHSQSHKTTPSVIATKPEKLVMQNKTVSQEETKWDFTKTFIIGAGKSIEYKLKKEKGERYKYLWSCNQGMLFYDFHGEPVVNPMNTFKSYEKGTKKSSTGSHTPLFEGTHGWYWKNITTDTVEVTLKTLPLTKENKSETVVKKTIWNDVVTLQIPAGGSKEYKFQINKGESLEYNWAVDQGKLFYDFHGEPLVNPNNSFKSYNKNTEAESSGLFVPTFNGTHGWYWKNNNDFPVNVTLKTKGIYVIKGIM
jgi:hypothetical protein